MNLVILQVPKSTRCNVWVNILAEPDATMLLLHCVNFHFEFTEGTSQLQGVSHFLVRYIICDVSEIDT